MNRNIKFYFVEDIISGVPVSGLIPANSDLVAVRGFIAAFKDKEEETKFHFDELRLILAFETDEKFNIEKEYQEVVCLGGDEAIEVEKQLKFALMQKEEGEE